VKLRLGKHGKYTHPDTLAECSAYPLYLHIGECKSHLQNRELSLFTTLIILVFNILFTPQILCGWRFNLKRDRRATFEIALERSGWDASARYFLVK
jgi:hypothetical protein